MVVPIDEDSGFTFTWIDDNRILLITTTSVAREAVDRYAAFALNALNSWPAEKPLLCMHLFAPELTVTPYLREQGEKLLSINRADIKGKLAIVTTNPVASTIFDLSFRSNSNMIPNLERRVFANRDSAHAWLVGNPNS